MAENKRPDSLVFNEAILKGFMNGSLEPAIEEKVANFLESRPELLEKIAAKSGDGFLNRLREVQDRTATEVPVEVKAELVSPIPVGKASTGKESSVPTQLANYSGYQVTKELGRGGMGVVYLAKNIQMDRMEVLKVLSERLLDHDGAKGRFLREIRAVSKLNHANIVTSYSILPLDNLMVFAMEYVHGMDLHKYIQTHPSMPIGQACSFAKQLASGLQHAHEKGLVHRDIKPSNVIVYKSDGKLQLKILDFGLAKASSEEASAGLTQDGTMLGTPEYMSPEQTLNAAKADIRADIYSLGCTLYCMLTGKPPFTGTHGAILMAHAQQEPKPINLVRPEVPVELAEVVGKMMAKDLRKRYQTPGQVAIALTPFVNQHRSAASKSTGAAAASNTVNDLNGPDRDTSVEAPIPEMSLDAGSRAIEPQDSFAVFAAPVRKERKRQPHISRLQRRTKASRNIPRWFWPTAIALGSLLGFFSLWQFGVFAFKTPNGTIVVENMPADAEVLVDGKKLEIVWNAGKDKAEVSIDPGTHQLKVLNQGNEIYGKKVIVKGGDSTLIKLLAINPSFATNKIGDQKTGEASNPSRTETPVVPSQPINNPSSSMATSDIQPSSAIDRTEWVQLFNGTDLSGWKGDKSNWSVRDGCITGVRTSTDKTNLNTSLIWDGGELEDFEIECECKVTSDGNSGMHFRSKIFDANQFDLSGYQADIDGKSVYTGIIYEERGRAILANLGESVVYDPSGSKIATAIGGSNTLKSAINGDDWNRYRLVAKGNKLQYYVNSRLASEVVDQDASKAATSGVLGLQLFAGRQMEVQFKNIRLKLLKQPETPNLSTISESKFTAGSVWEGTKTYRKGAYATIAGNTVSYFVHIIEIDGNKFKGHKFDNGSNRNYVRLEGEINGDQISWVEHSKSKFFIHGKITDDKIEFTFERNYSNVPRIDGDGKLICK